MGKQQEVREGWRERVAAQEVSGQSVRAYCQEPASGNTVSMHGGSD